MTYANNCSIAIVEDEAELAENFRAALEQRGYAVEVYADRPSAEAAFDKQLPDLVIIDIGLGQDTDGGFELCSYLRRISGTLPIIFLTARDAIDDEISGFRVGANDYLHKDAPQKMLLVRIEALIKRIAAMQSSSDSAKILERGACTINQDEYRILWNGQDINATVTEYWIILALAERPGAVKTREQCMDAANLTVEPETINSHIKRIRKKIRKIDPDANPITSEYALGYRWAG